MRFRPSYLLTAAALLAACNSDTTAPKSSLTREEAIAVAGSLAGSLEQAPQGARMNSDMPFAADPTTFTQDLEITAPCPQGGTANLKWHLNMTADPATGSLTLDATGTHTPSGCKILHDSTTLTVDGNPSLTFESHMAFANQLPTAPIVVKLNGGFNWSASDGRSGTCAIDFQETTNLIAKTRVRQGTVCGHAITETVSWT